jgi:transposase, IS30 family
VYLKALPGVVRRFWDHIGNGMSASEAGAAVGVSMHTGRKWFADAGGVRPRFPDDRPRKRPRLTLDERVAIEVGVKTGKSIRSIADDVGRHPSTVMRHGAIPTRGSAVSWENDGARGKREAATERDW